MIDVKTAVARAVEYISELLPKGTVRNLRLEEVERTDDDEHWLVTLGYSAPKDEGEEDLNPFLGSQSEREYKQFEIDAQTGEVSAMRIRTIG